MSLRSPKRQTVRRALGTLLTVFTLLVMLCGTSACSDKLAHKSSDEPAKPGEVAVKNMQFTPATITIGVGEQVTWRFGDSGKPHNVTGVGDAATLIASPILQDGIYSVTFATPGVYDYICSLHPEMKGKVIVK